MMMTSNKRSTATLSLLLLLMTWVLAILTFSPTANAEVVNSDLVLAQDTARNITLNEQISQILNLFSTSRLAENWNSVSEVMTRNCSRDMEQYLQGLAEHSIWALKSRSKQHFLFRRIIVVGQGWTS